jgi:pimeloyl-ACP methyl ester carboxylesterase
LRPEGETRQQAAGRSIPGLGWIGSRLAARLMNAPRRSPAEASLGPALDRLGGEVLRLRSRDGLRLAARWLPFERADPAWIGDPHEAILVLHGWTGSVAPDAVEYGWFLRRIAGVLALDFGGHGGSDDAPTTLGVREVEDVAGAIAWLGERGVRRVAVFGTSMGGITALAATVVLGDGTLVAADTDPSAPAAVVDAPRPLIVGIVADSVVAVLADILADRFPGPIRRPLAALAFAELARHVGGDPRDTEPIRIVGMVEPVPLLLIHGDRDPRVSIKAGRALASAAGSTADHWLVRGAGHATAHEIEPAAYEERVTSFLRRTFLDARGADPIIAASPALQAVEPAAEAAHDSVTEFVPTGRMERD